MPSSPGAAAAHRRLLNSSLAWSRIAFGSVLPFPAASHCAAGCSTSPPCCRSSGMGLPSPCPPSAGTAWRKPSETAALLGHRDQPAGEAALAAAIPPRSAAREEELLLQSHTSYYLPTKGSVCTAGREPEDRDSPGDLQRMCSRQAEALIAPDRYALGHPSTWPGAAEPPGMLPTSLQPLSASKPPRQPLAWVGFFPFQRTSSFQVSARRKRQCCCQRLATARCQHPV